MSGRKALYCACKNIIQEYQKQVYFHEIKKTEKNRLLASLFDDELFDSFDLLCEGSFNISAMIKQLITNEIGSQTFRRDLIIGLMADNHGKIDRVLQEAYQNYNRKIWEETEDE